LANDNPNCGCNKTHRDPALLKWKKSHKPLPLKDPPILSWTNSSLLPNLAAQDSCGEELFMDNGDGCLFLARFVGPVLPQNRIDYQELCKEEEHSTAAKATAAWQMVTKLGKHTAETTNIGDSKQ
jgi:hypothetical protein